MLVISGKVVDLPKKCSGHRSSDAKTCRKYGDVSGMLAQVNGVAAFFAEKPEQIVHVIGIGVMDDASMLVKDPATHMQWELGLRSEGSKINGSLWKREKTIHLPVMSASETVFVRRQYNSEDQRLHGCTIHSGSVPLCQANTSTVRSQWKSVSMMNPDGPGNRVDPDGVVDDV